MKKLTDEQIETLAVKAMVECKNGDTFRLTVANAIRAAMALADEPEPAPQPARKPWPTGLDVVRIDDADWRLRKPVSGTGGIDIFKAYTKEHIEAAALALDILPRCAAMLRRKTDDLAERQAVLAIIDAAGFDLPE